MVSTWRISGLNLGLIITTLFNIQAYNSNLFLISLCVLLLNDQLLHSIYFLFFDSYMLEKPALN